MERHPVKKMAKHTTTALQKNFTFMITPYIYFLTIGLNPYYVRSEYQKDMRIYHYNEKTYVHMSVIVTIPTKGDKP